MLGSTKYSILGGAPNSAAAVEIMTSDKHTPEKNSENHFGVIRIVNNDQLPALKSYVSHFVGTAAKKMTPIS